MEAATRFIDARLKTFFDNRFRVVFDLARRSVNPADETELYRKFQISKFSNLPKKERKKQSDKPGYFFVFFLSAFVLILRSNPVSVLISASKLGSCQSGTLFCSANPDFILSSRLAGWPVSSLQQKCY